jgi:hypothetical protein
MRIVLLGAGDAFDEKLGNTSDPATGASSRAGITVTSEGADFRSQSADRYKNGD